MSDPHAIRPTDFYLELIREMPQVEPDQLLPGWAGLATLFGAPSITFEEANTDLIAAGIPIDATTSSRPGAAEGPLAIRIASRIMSWQLKSLGTESMYDTRTGKTFTYKQPSLCDVGDFPIYPTDPTRTFKSLASRAAMLADRGKKLLFLGGDHSIVFPLFTGFSGAHRGNVADVGYIQVDNHFDFGNRSEIHGYFYHGSNARRISELPGFNPQHMAFIGVAHATRLAQYRNLLSDGYHVVPAAEIRCIGVIEALRPVIESLRQCRTVYLSIDIDVLDAAFAPGTGAVTIGGLDTATLLDIIEVLAALPIGALDLVEVAPRYDPTGRTAQLAAQVLFELLFRIPHDCTPP